MATPAVEWLIAKNNYIFMSKLDTLLYSNDTGSSWKLLSDIQLQSGEYILKNAGDMSVQNMVCFGTTYGRAFIGTPFNNDVISENTNATQNQIEIVPSPAHNDINVNIPGLYQNQDLTITIYNSIGKKIYSNELYNNGQININIGKFSPGIYFLVANNHIKTLAKSFIISE